MRNLLWIGVALIGLAACGGGGGSGTAAVPSSGQGPRTTASIAFTVPVGSQAVADVGRASQDVAAAAQRFSIFEDGAALFTDVALQPGTTAAPGAESTATVTAGTGNASFTVTVTVATGAGSHTFGVVVTAVDGTVLAAAQGTYSLAGGSSSTNAVTLPLSGGIASGYIECATPAQIAAGNNCANYANFDTSTALYTFTAVAADSSGYPIGTQLGNGGAVPFANGAYKVIESASDNPAIVSITGGPWSSPGSAFPAATGAYGNTFNVRCIHRGTAQLQLQLVGGTPAVQIAGYTYDPSKFPPPNSVLPIGTRSTTSVAVNCTASGSLTIN
ncbi:MAG TPA: hypothetical protein VGU66_19860 [Candidatus Elarobacter sp.]|nr:hypothetical protein [Candidatus Elarobacter sp.]